MRERPRPKGPPPSPTTSRGKYFALGAVVLLAAGVTGLWTLSAYRIRVGPGDPTDSSPNVTILEETMLGEATLEETVLEETVIGETMLEEKNATALEEKNVTQKGIEAALPQCFSSPEADPSEGEWRSCRGGVDDAPTKHDDWALPEPQFDFLNTCRDIWNDPDHPGPKVPRPYWDWEPANCSLDAVDEAKFCRAMEGRKGLLLVGDSLTRLSTSTLAAVLRAKPIDFGTLEDAWEACGGELEVRFIRNDYLDARVAPPFVSETCEDVPVGPTERKTRCELFGTDATLRDFDTLVVNSGAHPRPAAKYGRQMHAAAELLASSMNRLHGKDKAILVVRNTVPGHWGCTERMFADPVNATVAAGLVAEAPLKYEWKALNERNAQLQRAFSPDRGWRLLDAYTPTLLRADSHISINNDCLHYCMPGPADHWIILLYNIILAATNGA